MDSQLKYKSHSIFLMSSGKYNGLILSYFSTLYKRVW
jgi:hypothetical protein